MTSNKPLHALFAGILFLVASVCAGQAAAQAWIQLAPSGTPPAQRYLHTAVYAPASNSMIVFDGCGNAGCPFNDVWVLSHADGTGGTSAWTQLNPTGTPSPARDQHTAVYVPASNSMVVFGGYNGNILNATWVLSHADGTGGTPAWIQLSPTGTLPSARYIYTAV